MAKIWKRGPLSQAETPSAPDGVGYIYALDRPPNDREPPAAG
jgi:hypothetical protein